VRAVVHLDVLRPAPALPFRVRELVSRRRVVLRQIRGVSVPHLLPRLRVALPEVPGNRRVRRERVAVLVDVPPVHRVLEVVPVLRLQRVFRRRPRQRGFAFDQSRGELLLDELVHVALRRVSQRVDRVLERVRAILLERVVIVREALVQEQAAAMVVLLLLAVPLVVLVVIRAQPIGQLLRVDRVDVRLDLPLNAIEDVALPLVVDLLALALVRRPPLVHHIVHLAEDPARGLRVLLDAVDAAHDVVQHALEPLVRAHRALHLFPLKRLQDVVLHLRVFRLRVVPYKATSGWS